MTSVLEYQRRKVQFQKELFRRIGYTNTLYQIFRFGEIVRDTSDLFPVSQIILVNRIRVLRPELKQQKYVTGVIDILGALNIARRAGPRVVLTPRGRALAAIVKQRWYDKVKSHFFLRSILEADGDYILNLLSLIDGTHADSEAIKSLGISFFRKILEMLELREGELVRCLSSRFIRSIATQQVGLFKDSIRYDILNEKRPPRTLTLEKRLKLVNAERAQKGKTGGITRLDKEPSDTVRHTLDPRRGWLEDLGLAAKGEANEYHLTPVGVSLLERVRSDGFQLGNTLRVPFSTELVTALGINEACSIPKGYFGQIIMEAYLGRKPQEYGGTVEDFFADVEFFFDLIRLKRFNQAEIPALYECIALKAAAIGQLLTEEHFHILLDTVFKKYGDQLFRVSGRYGGEGYISFRG
jgi:hypothetical protein